MGCAWSCRSTHCGGGGGGNGGGDGGRGDRNTINFEEQWTLIGGRLITWSLLSLNRCSHREISASSAFLCIPSIISTCFFTCRLSVISSP